MMDPNADPFAAAPAAEGDVPVNLDSDVQIWIGAAVKRIYLHRVWRCTSVCPANITGKTVA
jgi:hypothetical protein